MGKNMIFLSEKEGPYYYGDTSPTRLELEECIHFHHGAFRNVWTTEEFRKIVPLFLEASKKMEEIGWPKNSEHMKLLSGEKIGVSPLQKNRWAIEITSSNFIHLHMGNLRILLQPLDFEWLLNMFREATVEFYQYEKSKIDITSDNIILPAHVKSEYIPLLKDYKNSKYPKVKATDVKKLYSKVKWHIRYPNHEATSEKDMIRPMDEDFVFRAGTVPKDLDREYLFAVYESIKEWGYADGPFYGELLSVLKLDDGRLQITNAHRVAALLVLEYSEIDVFCSRPRDNS